MKIGHGTAPNNTICANNSIRTPNATLRLNNIKHRTKRDIRGFGTFTESKEIFGVEA